jgi:hypothetical protein
MREKILVPNTSQPPGLRRIADAMRAVSKELPEFDEDNMPEVPAWALNRSRPEGGGGRPTL